MFSHVLSHLHFASCIEVTCSSLVTVVESTFLCLVLVPRQRNKCKQLSEQYRGTRSRWKPNLCYLDLYYLQLLANQKNFSLQNSKLELKLVSLPAVNKQKKQTIHWALSRRTHSTVFRISHEGWENGNGGHQTISDAVEWVLSDSQSGWWSSMVRTVAAVQLQTTSRKTSPANRFFPLKQKTISTLACCL